MYINAIIRSADSIAPEQFFDAPGKTVAVPVPWSEATEWAEQFCRGEGRTSDGIEWFDRGPLRNSIWRRCPIGSTSASVLVVLVLHSGPRPELVVTRHPNLVKVLIERGIIDDSTPVIDRAVRAAVKDRHVLGTLPYHLGGAAASVTEIPMRLSLAALSHSWPAAPTPTRPKPLHSLAALAHSGPSAPSPRSRSVAALPHAPAGRSRSVAALPHAPAGRCWVWVAHAHAIS
jgi:hypothetical protein